MPSLTEAIGQNKPHCTRTIVECICDVVMSRVPLRARWTGVLNHIKTNNAMGDLGEHMLTFSEGLMHDLHQSQWESMNVSQVGVIMWLSDLTLTNPHHLRLSEKIHATWDLAEANNKQFSIMDCISCARTHDVNNRSQARQ